MAGTVWCGSGAGLQVRRAAPVPGLGVAGCPVNADGQPFNSMPGMLPHVLCGCIPHHAALCLRCRSLDLVPANSFLRQLCFFAKPAAEGDLHLLAVACRLVLAGQQPAAAGAPPQPPQLMFCMQAAGGGEQAATVVWQAQRLVSVCLAALAQQAPALGAELTAPRLGATAAAASSSHVPPVLEVLLLLTAPDSWKAALGDAGAAQATAQILAAATASGLFGQLAAIAAAACPEESAAAAGTGGGTSPAARQAVPSGEAVVTALTVRYLSQQAAIARCLEQRQQRKKAPALEQQGPVAAGQPAAGAQQTAQLPAATQQGGTTAERQLPLLLCVPLLLRRLPTLKPAAARVWRHTVAVLHSLSPAELAAWLRAQHPGTEAALAGAALLGNLLDGASAALKAEDAQQLAAVRQPALQFAALACALLALLPQQPFFPSSDGEVGAGGPQPAGSSRWADDDDEEEAQAAVRTAAAAAAPAAAKLPWDEEQLPSAGLVAQLQLVADSRLLRSMVRAVLPQVDGGSSGALQGAALAQRATDVRRLCGLLQQLMALPGQRQRLLVVLAFSAELVQRLWFSYLRPAQASPGGQGAVRWVGVVRWCGAAEIAELVASFAGCSCGTKLLPALSLAVACSRRLGAVRRRQLRPRLDAAPGPLQPGLQLLHHHRWVGGWVRGRGQMGGRQLHMPWPRFRHVTSPPQHVRHPPPSCCPPSAGDDELYNSQRPLPLEELHSAAHPGGGVLALLKMALWHALWVEAPPAPGEDGRCSTARKAIRWKQAIHACLLQSKR